MVDIGHVTAAGRTGAWPGGAWPPLGVYMDKNPLVPGYDAVCCLGVYMDKNPPVSGHDDM